jgi:hypothetical protein
VELDLLPVSNWQFLGRESEPVEFSLSVFLEVLDELTAADVSGVIQDPCRSPRSFLLKFLDTDWHQSSYSRVAEEHAALET